MIASYPLAAPAPWVSTQGQGVLCHVSQGSGLGDDTGRRWSFLTHSGKLEGPFMGSAAHRGGSKEC